MDVLGLWGIDVQATYNVYTAPGWLHCADAQCIHTVMAMNPQAGLLNADGQVRAQGQAWRCRPLAR